MQNTHLHPLKFAFLRLMLEHTQAARGSFKYDEAKNEKEEAHLVPSTKKLNKKERNQSLQTTRAKRNINFYPKCHVFWPSTMGRRADGGMKML